MARKLKKITVPDEQGNPVEYDVGGVDATTATAGQAPIADGAGGWAWGDVQSSGSGLTTAQKSTLMAVINAIGAFNVPNGQEVIDAFNSAWETTVESISVNPTTLTFNGVEVKTITATTVPSGEPVIWTSSDASVAEVENGQVASVGNGTCVITASSGDKSATCRVTVTGIARSYTVTNNLTNVTNSNDNSLVAEGGTYEGTLTAESGYAISSVVITMGGIDVTSTVYSDGAISISNVTGDIVITASASAVPTEVDVQSMLTAKGYYYDGYADANSQSSHKGTSSDGSATPAYAIEIISGKTYTVKTAHNTNSGTYLPVAFSGATTGGGITGGGIFARKNIAQISAINSSLVATEIESGVYELAWTFTANNTGAVYMSIGCLNNYLSYAHVSYI